MIYGIDVSDDQAAHPPLAGSSFVIIKATEGHTYVNPKAAQQAAYARSQGKEVGFYHFLWPGNIAAQVAYFVANAPSLPGDTLWIDWEPTKGGLATNAEKDAAIRGVQAVRGSNHRVGLYCDRSRWIDVDKTSFAGDGLWIADPSAKAGQPGISAPWVIHQFSSAGGIDRDAGIWTSVAAMHAWAVNHPSAPAPKPAPKPAANTYTVQEGDTLDSIARAHKTTWQTLASINHLSNPNLIRPGQIIHLK